MAKHMSDEYWHDLLMATRTSGLVDAVWCEQHDMAGSSFYYHLRKLRGREYAIPDSTGTTLAEVKQDVVPVTLFEEEPITSPPTCSNTQESALCLYLNGAKIEINNHANPLLIQSTLYAVNNLC